MSNTTAQRAIVHMCGLRGLGTLETVKGLLTAIGDGIASPAELRRQLGQQRGAVRTLAESLLHLMPRAGQESFGAFDLWFHLGDLLRGRDWMGSSRPGDGQVRGDLVVLQQLPGDVIADEDAAARFDAEHLRLATMEHPHVMPCLGHGVVDGTRPYRVVPFQDGIPLRRLLARRGTLGVEEVLLVGLHAGKGLAAVHGAGLVHRDLTPDGLFVTARGVVRVADVGRQGDRPPGEPPEVTSITPKETGWTDQSVSSSGTRQWRRLDGSYYDWRGMPRSVPPPERLGGTPPDARGDLYGLGQVLFTCLTGAEPFAGVGDAERERAQRQAPPDPVAIRPDLDPDLGRVVRACLAADPESRPTAVMLVERIEGILDRLRVPLDESLPSGAFITRKGAARPAQTATVRIAREPTGEVPATATAGLVAALGHSQVSSAGHDVDPGAADGYVGERLALVGHTGGLAVTLVGGCSLAIGRTDGPLGIAVAADPHLGRHHLTVDCPPGALRPTVSDLGSANGTALDGAALPAHAAIPLPRHGLVRIAGVVDVVVACQPRRSLRRVPDPGTSPVSGIDADQSWDAVVLTHLGVIGQQILALVLRSVTIGGPGSDILIGDGGEGVEVGRLAGRWVVRPAAGGRWTALRPGNRLLAGGQALTVRVL